jgi:CO/xanthine dehydrogenase Mo-binding subunit/xanthine dehydrogenase iron-sulfur cluster and FAD-binding subunit A
VSASPAAPRTRDAVPYLRPTTLEGALEALADGERLVVAGGTDVYPATVTRPPTRPVLDITALPDLRGVREVPDGWWIPALTTWTDLAETRLPSAFDGLRTAARAIGGRQIQNAATVCGNVVNASPAADGVPNLLALDASVELASAGGVRSLPLTAFLTGYRTTARRPEELVTGLLVPRPAADGELRSAFLKLGARAYLVISIVAVAVVLEVAGERVAGARVAVGACSPVARRLRGLESTLAGLELDRLRDPAEVAELVSEGHLADLSPIDDVRATAAYRLDAALTLVRRSITEAASPSSDPAGGRIPLPGRSTRSTGSSGSTGSLASAASSAATSTTPGPGPIEVEVNGRQRVIATDGRRRLVDVLREDLGLTGTKVGCNAGDCGACTVRVDGQQTCACLVPIGQMDGRSVMTVEGLSTDGRLGNLQAAFLAGGAAQCGACTPGMLMAADDLLARVADPTPAAVADALGGVLCRCTGYGAIASSVLAAAGTAPDTTDATPVEPGRAAAVGARIARVDGEPKVTGRERFGDDSPRSGELVLRVVRAPHARARFTVGDLGPFRARHPGLAAVLTARDIPGQNRFGIYPTGKDQPVLADGIARYRGEAVLALVGEPGTVATIDDTELPISWTPLEPVVGIEAGLAATAPQLHQDRPGNVLVEGIVRRGDVDAALAGAAAVASGTFQTTFVEHAYIEPEAGMARVVDGRIEVYATTQTPYMDRDELALILGVDPERVRVIPSACGGGFGGKLDLSIQPLLATAALRLGRPVRGAYSRPESMAATTKRHPARITATFGAAADGRLTGVRVHADFDTGAYASWGPTVANRVPVHAAGPYEVPAAACTSRAVHTNGPPSGAFRGFGVPQMAIAHEAMLDELAAQLGIDPLEIRLRNALRAGSRTQTGQRLSASVGMVACLEALRPRWAALRAAAADHNADPQAGASRRGVGIGAMWYGIGNTALPNPSVIEVGVRRDGSVVLVSGAVDIGQGSSTVLAQIAADALGVPVAGIIRVGPDTDASPDAGKTSASRQTFVSGNAARLAGLDLRRQILALAEAPEDATIAAGKGRVVVRSNGTESIVELGELAEVGRGCVVLGRGRYDPKTTPLDADGQGDPYETYAFGAQLAVVDVDRELGTVAVRRIVAAHDVGRAINPGLVEGQIRGGVAQGLGLALMEDYVPGRTDNLHDYLIPTIGDMPEIECILIEDPEPAGPFGAKGVGEPALIPTAPAILAAIRDATGARMTGVPATPDRVRAALLELGATTP